MDWWRVKWQPWFQQGGGGNYYSRSMYAGGMSSPPQQQLEVVYLYIPEQSVGAVIGSKGQNIKNIMHLSGARVKVRHMKGFTQWSGVQGLVFVHVLVMSHFIVYTVL